MYIAEPAARRSSPSLTDSSASVQSISNNITCLELHIVSFETMTTIQSKSHDMRKDVEIDMVERCEASSSDDLPQITKSTTMGTVTINDSEEIFLVPSPSSDPRGIQCWWNPIHMTSLTI
jgi:hypothetical protein